MSPHQWICFTICGRAQLPISYPVFPIRQGKVPAVYHGADVTTAHADVEWVPVESIVHASRVYILSALKYLGLS